MKKLLIILSFSLLMAQDIATYYKIDIEAIKISLNFSKKKLNCLKNDCPLKELYNIDEQRQKKIEKLYAKYNTTPSKQIGFYTNHKKEAIKYYEHNETLQKLYQNLQEERELINNQIKTLMENKNETSN